MVFMHSSDGRLRVLDGQQRLATTVIILSAIRAWFRLTEEGTPTANSIQMDFIGRSDYGSKEMLPKLSLNINNDARYQRYVVNGSPLTEIRKERASVSKNSADFPLLDAINYAHTRLERIAGDHGDPAKTNDYLIRLLLFIRDSVVVVRLTVPNEANAFRVFETLNDRGLDLSAADLLKNYLFGLAHDVSPTVLQQIEHRWSQITHELNDVNEADFLKVFWTSRYGRTQLDAVFDDARQRVKTGKVALSLSVELLEAAEQYVALDNGEDVVWLPFTARTKERINHLSMLGSKQIRPVLLSALKQFEPDEMDKLVALLESIIVRYQLIGGERTGPLEIQCARLAQLIWEREVLTADDARSAVSSICPDNNQFRAAFINKEGISNQKASYIIKMIERHERANQRGTDAKALDPGKSLSLEHVLPKGGGSGWATEISADQGLVTDCVLKLGNLCLLTESRNRELERRSYVEKRAVYEASELLTTQRVAKSDRWDRDSIHHHQVWLASRAVLIWNYNYG